MIVFEGLTKGGKKLLVRYPTLEDTERMQRYFNALSAERTFIRSQGEQVSFEEERAFVETALKNISEQKSIRLLAFVDGEIAGVSNIDMYDKTDRHLGELGISIAKEFRGKGLGEQFMTILIEEAAKALPQLEIITLGVFSTNKTARILYKRLGFQEYGVLPQGVKLGENYVDYVRMYKPIRGPVS